ncbi:MAG: hypothetical protein HON90_17615 [Halobacteriovoraceae bacterium]|jgi:hypothetical protein|nr:hypothetical protein [Halobacteriovoraceae bacterium]
MSSFASFEGLYNGETRKGAPCSLEIIAYEKNENNIIVSFKSSMQKDNEYIFKGYGDIDGYTPGQVSGDYEVGNTEELAMLYFNIDRSSKEVKALTTMTFNRWVGGKRKVDDVCTYLEKQ